MFFNFKDEKRKSFLHEKTSITPAVIKAKIVNHD
ncbi:hypothetical protein ZPR_1931 [Zunongwangia profunda SM-A87]|uniref:Uncharacterized protein n=1 Tax=Zunongwangia profunda (strain DSM 18752 / CCTCC AB 206139 / SM-A87) TaxID=655815 RepID=D5B9V8_ZUNPS|nr:hypothetical protein ZPR_1931 [Zunongwangia profunda SM-A87]